MGYYKGIEVADRLHGLIRHMGDVEEYRETLQKLQGVWDNLTLLGQLSGTGTDMSGTRQAFHQLTTALIDNLGTETLKKAVLALKSKAQVAVDIMIRNLFERTADIGFLATDDDVREYLERVRQGTAEPTEGDRLAERFREYVAKYSVYFNIILLDTEGRVLIQLDRDNPVARSRDPLLRESLTTTRAYVETFRQSDLLPDQPVSLIYSYRVTDDQSQPLGVMCLCFRFANETAGIFADLTEAGDWSVITLLDRDGKVIASGEEHHIPIGTRMEMVLDGDSRVVRFAGREYLASTRPTQGYQGYMGPGWYGHAMIPVQHAFGKDASDLLKGVPERTLADVMRSPSLFGESLRRIPVQAERIQAELNRSVWNGHVRQSSDRAALNPAFSKILLWEISNTGLKTKDVFERSIGNLNETVVSAILQDSQFVASLAIDIMDRNLYERANDCRWWALTSAFRETLGGGRVDQPKLTAILRAINALYTVYDDLVLFDRTGRVVAVSNRGREGMVGQVLTDDWVRQTLGLRDQRSYAVSPFAPTPFYSERHTYVYGAAIFDRRVPGLVVGGIGIVFDSGPQFEAMLKDALPRDETGEVPAGCFAVFADRQRAVIASTRGDLPPGATIDLDERFFRLAAGEGVSNIVAYQGTLFAVGSRMSKGYREYKGAADPYRNDVVALVFVALGEVAAERPTCRKVERTRLQVRSAHAPEARAAEIASFHVGASWLGIRSSRVVQAIDALGITVIPGATRHLVGYAMFRGAPIPVIDVAELLRERRAVGGACRQIVVVEAEGRLFGLLIDELGEIPEVADDAIERLALMGGAEDSSIAEGIATLTDTDGATRMLIVLDPDLIVQRLRVPRDVAQPVRIQQNGATSP
ncbi:MAG: chemotaxis protein CheW [Alphaproteobacteria bacterium]|nr:chemotaxis protein CheW [Alphaproteobacteria bacterium]